MSLTDETPPAITEQVSRVRPQPQPQAGALRFGAADPARPVTVAPRGLEPVAEPARSRGRRRLLAVLAALVLLAGGFAAGWFLRPAAGPAVLVLTRAVAAGAPIADSDLAVRHLTSPPSQALDATAPHRGLFARVALPMGAVLTSESVTTTGALPAAGKVVVGVALRPGQAPPGLHVGDIVRVLVPTSTNDGRPARPVVLVDAVRVVDVRDSSSGQEASIEVPAVVADRVAANAAEGKLALGWLPPGSATSTGAPAPEPAPSPAASPRPSAPASRTSKASGAASAPASARPSARSSSSPR